MNTSTRTNRYFNIWSAVPSGVHQEEQLAPRRRKLATRSNRISLRQSMKNSNAENTLALLPPYLESRSLVVYKLLLGYSE